MWLQHARVHRQAVHEPGLIEGTQPQVRLCQACGHQDGEPVGEPDGTVERCQLNLGFGHMFTSHINISTGLFDVTSACMHPGGTRAHQDQHQQSLEAITWATTLSWSTRTSARPHSPSAMSASARFVRTRARRWATSRSASASTSSVRPPCISPMRSWDWPCMPIASAYQGLPPRRAARMTLLYRDRRGPVGQPGHPRRGREAQPCSLRVPTCQQWRLHAVLPPIAMEAVCLVHRADQLEPSANS